MPEEEKSKKENLTKFPNAEKANREAPGGLPSAFDLFKPSVEIIKNNLVAFLVLVGLPLVLTLIGQGQHMFSSGAASFEVNKSYGTLSSIGGLLALLFAPGAILLQLAGARKQTLSMGDAFSQGLKHFWRLLGLVILLIIILTLSFILLIVPFFLVLPRVFLAPYFLIDQKMGVVDSIKASNDAYKKHHGIWGVIGVLVLMGLASIVPVIGNLAANILSFLYGPAVAIRYEQIKNMLEDKAPGTPIETGTKPVTS